MHTRTCSSLHRPVSPLLTQPAVAGSTGTAPAPLCPASTVPAEAGPGAPSGASKLEKGPQPGPPSGPCEGHTAPPQSTTPAAAVAGVCAAVGGAAEPCLAGAAQAGCTGTGERRIMIHYTISSSVSKVCCFAAEPCLAGAVQAGHTGTGERRVLTHYTISSSVLVRFAAVRQSHIDMRELRKQATHRDR